MAEGLYSLSFSPATPHGAAVWTVFGKGFGLRCFYTKEDAVKEANAYFGTALFTIRLRGDRTEMHVSAAPGADPKAVLDQAIAALQAELADLDKCPVHRVASR